MSRVKLTTLFILLLTGCAPQRERPDTEMSDENFDFVIRNGQIGNLKTGVSLQDAFETLQGFVVKLDSVSDCEGCGVYTPMYRVGDGYQQLFSFEPGWDSLTQDKVFRIFTGNKSFTTNKGIKVGMTVLDLKSMYEVEEVVVGGETGVHVIAKDFNGAFGVELPATNDWWKVNKENIPDSLEIQSIIIL